MQERTRTLPPTETTGGGLPSLFGDDSIFTPMATAVHGVHDAPTPANQTVGEIRRRLHDRLAIEDGATAFINGQAVGDDVRVLAGQTLEFMKQAGKKGCRARRAA